jgi:Flp pilus assembly protein TadB
MEILKNKKVLSIIIGLFLILAVAGWIAAGIQKSRADRSRGEVDALGKKIEEMKAENMESDRAWKDKLYEAEKKYEEAEKRRKEAAAEFSKWKPTGRPPPGTTEELVRRFKNAGVRATPRGAGR